MMVTYLSVMCGESHCGGAAADMAARVSGVGCLHTVGLQLPSHDWRSMVLARKGMSDTADQHSCTFVKTIEVKMIEFLSD